MFIVRYISFIALQLLILKTSILHATCFASVVYVPWKSYTSTRCLWQAVGEKLEKYITLTAWGCCKSSAASGIKWRSVKLSAHVFPTTVIILNAFLISKISLLVLSGFFCPPCVISTMMIFLLPFHQHALAQVSLAFNIENLAQVLCCFLSDSSWNASHSMIRIYPASPSNPNCSILSCGHFEERGKPHCMFMGGLVKGARRKEISDCILIPLSDCSDLVAS